VKRIRRDGAVEVTACDLRGRTTHGPTVRGKARLLDDEDTERVRGMLRTKYGIVGTVSLLASALRGGKRRTIGVAITLEHD
jgi:uncharacterized protein